MGSDNSIEKQRFLTKDEIKKESDNFILELFQKNKGVEGDISKNDFNRMTNGLIDISIINIIFQLCSSKNDKLSKNDFKYFYALLKTKSIDAKINFLLYFIFEKNTELESSVYISLVKKYYINSHPLYEIFLNNNIIINRVIEKKNVFEFIKNNFKQRIENYVFNKELSIYSNIDLEEEKIIDNNHKILSLPKNTCICLTKKNNNIYFSTDFYSINASLMNRYDSLKIKFEEYKSKNNGIFPLSLVRKMLKEIHIIPSLIDLITNYIEKKTQKGICTFELFKEFLTILTIELEGEESENKKIFKEGLFLLFSYPNDYIDKTSFCSFIQLTKNNFSLNSINDILNKYKIPKKIYIDKFGDIFDFLISELSPYLEKIKYIPYIFFNNVITNKKIERNCIIILLNGKNLNDYIIDSAKYENKFYIINFDFWETWTKNINLQNYEELKNLKINTEKLCDRNGQIKEGLVYFVNYIILTEQIYKLFCNWYGKPEIEIEREKIIIENEEDNETYYQNIYSINKFRDNIFIGEDSKTKKKFEIEINPVFLLFLLYQELPSIIGNSFSNLKEEIKKKIEDNSTKFTKCSRKTKFSKLLLILQEKTKMELDENNSRLWIYYHDRFEIINNINETLEKQGIYNKAVILLEINKLGKWPMDELKEHKSLVVKEEESPLVGLMNLGNSCYLNSVLQIFLNIKEMKYIYDRILNEGNNFLNFLLNCTSEKIILVEEFIQLLKLKFYDKKRTLIPKNFKETCGKFNENFGGLIQQDANDFYIFLLQSLHEGMNIKTKNIYIENRDKLNKNETENDLGNECWANHIRNNASFIYSLFSGQLQSKLICNKCKKEKIKYEPYCSLDLPIPENNNIVIFIKLFRLPLFLSSFKNLEKIKLDKYNNNEKKTFNKKKIFDISINEQMNLEAQNFQKLDNLHRTFIKDELITNELNINIPIFLKLVISRKEKCEKIIKTLKSMSELSLDLKGKYTNYIIISRNRYINPDLIINDTLDNFDPIEIYELLNFEGIKHIFKYQDLSVNMPLPITNQEINYTISNAKDNIVESNDNKKEILIEIKHRVKRDWEENNFLVNISLFSYMKTYRDFIILSNYNSIKIFDLYELIWKKYMYFCDMPTKLENNLWWKKIFSENLNENICSPFILKIVNKKTLACNYCPWYKFCTGCILNPLYKGYISIPKNCYLIVEWCRKVKLKQIKDENILLYLNHSSINDDIETDLNKKISIYDCLSLFTQKEEIEDIHCENCNKNQIFTKILRIERIPKYLVLTLKRFKYTLMYRTKITCPIKFPINDINLNEYLTNEENPEINKKYDLFAVINHLGNLSGGHYFSIIEQNNKWIKYNDSYVSDFTRTFDTQEAYMLIYKLNENNPGNINLKLRFNFWGLMNTAYKIYMKKSLPLIFNYLINKEGKIIEEYQDICYYYYGEPIKYNDKMGYILNIYNKENKSYYMKIKCSDKIEEIKYENNNIIKETLKDNNLIKSHNNFKFINERIGCTNDCIII